MSIITRNSYPDSGNWRGGLGIPSGYKHNSTRAYIKAMPELDTDWENLQELCRKPLDGWKSDAELVSRWEDDLADLVQKYAELKAEKKVVGVVYREKSNQYCSGKGFALKVLI